MQNIQEYLDRQKIITETPGFFSPAGSFRIYNGEVVTEKQFRKMFPPVRMYKNVFKKELIGCVQ